MPVDRIWICPQCAHVEFVKPRPREHYCTGTRVGPTEMDEYVTTHAPSLPKEAATDGE